MKNKGGRPKLEKSFAAMLRIAIQEATGVGTDGQKITRLREIVDQLVKEASSGNMQAINIIADRLDGKPLQMVEHSGEIETTSKEQRDAAVAAALKVQEDERAKLH